MSDDQVRKYREMVGPLTPEKLASLRNQVAELKRDGRIAHRLYAAMLEYYCDLHEYFWGGHTDALSQPDFGRFLREFTGLGDWLFIEPAQYDEVLVEKLVGLMHDSGLSEEDRVRERKIGLARRRGKSRTWDSLAETFMAAALRLEGKEYSEIADIICPNKSHRPHWNRGRRARKDRCVSRLDQRVNPLLKFLRECGFEFSRG